MSVILSNFLSLVINPRPIFFAGLKHSSNVAFYVIRQRKAFKCCVYISWPINQSQLGTFLGNYSHRHKYHCHVKTNLIIISIELLWSSQHSYYDQVKTNIYQLTKQSKPAEKLSQQLCVHIFDCFLIHIKCNHNPIMQISSIAFFSTLNVYFNATNKQYCMKMTPTICEWLSRVI